MEKPCVAVRGYRPSGLGIQGWRLRVQDFGLWALGTGIGTQVTGFRAMTQVTGFRALGRRFEFQGTGIYALVSTFISRIYGNHLGVWGMLGGQDFLQLTWWPMLHFVGQMCDLSRTVSFQYSSSRGTIDDFQWGALVFLHVGFFWLGVGI